jgi:hypothetical protein
MHCITSPDISTFSQRMHFSIVKLLFFAAFEAVEIYTCASDPYQNFLILSFPEHFYRIPEHWIDLNPAASGGMDRRREIIMLN